MTHTQLALTLESTSDPCLERRGCGVRSAVFSLGAMRGNEGIATVPNSDLGRKQRCHSHLPGNITKKRVRGGGKGVWPCEDTEGCPGVLGNK